MNSRTLHVMVWILSVMGLHAPVLGTSNRREKIPSASNSSCAVSHQISRSACIPGKSFGCNVNDTVWVAEGCRGVFTLPSGETVQCWSVCKDGQRTTCEPGNFTPPQPPYHCGPSPSPHPPSPHRLPPFTPTSAPNMNGEYFRSETGTEVGARHQTRPYHEYPGGVRYFDVYSPIISSLYSQVFWTALPPVDIPREVIERYQDGGVMAMVGLECDQVQKNATGDGRDVSVPINAAYNHHFTVTLAGSKAIFERVSFNSLDDPRRQEFANSSAHRLPDVVYRVRELQPGVGGVSTSLGLGGGNGGEYRKTFHGFPAPYARLIESPRQVQFTPMQIDTWHREKMSFNISGSSPFVAGPQPRNSLAKHPSALYSGLLECPLTTRITKQMQADATLRMSGACPYPTTFASECFSNAKAALGPSLDSLARVKTLTGSDPTRPVGCSVALDNGDVSIFFNNAKQGESCGMGATTIAGTIASVTKIQIEIDRVREQVNITLTGPSTVWFGVGFGAQAMKDTPWTIIVDGNGTVSERRLADQSPGELLERSVEVLSSRITDGKRTVVLTRGLKGQSPKYFTFDTNAATIPIINAVGSGPTLSFHRAKDPVVLSLLPVDSGGVCVCSGKPAPFGTQKGKLQYTPTNQTGEKGTPGATNFGNYCPPDSSRDDLRAHMNPTCDIRSYTGGQIACHHMWSLLDKEQDIPWPDQPLEYQMKFRFWYQDYNASFHRDLHYSGGTNNWDVGAGSGTRRPAGAEYDVPQCNSTSQPGCRYEDFMGKSLPVGSPGGVWVHYVTGHFYIGESPTSGPWKPIVAHMHCHAPTCLSMAIYDNRTGAPICVERATYGGVNRSAAQERENAAAFDRPTMNEPGFVAVPPCLWGDASEYNGDLESATSLGGVPLRVVKRCNATFGHHGEMAHGQIFYAVE